MTSSGPIETDIHPTLPFRGRILVRRLESFGDIVVGFSISQLALQLGVPKSPADLVADPSRYVYFFATFAIIATLWLRYHRMLTMGFAPGRIDLGAAFAFLAFTALLPYSLFAVNRISHDARGIQYGLAAYTIVLLGTTVSGFVITIRSLRRSIGILPSTDIARLRQRLAIEAGVTGVLLFGLVLNFTIGAKYAGPAYMLVAVVVRVARWRFPAEKWDVAHVHGRPA